MWSGDRGTCGKHGLAAPPYNAGHLILHVIERLRSSGTSFGCVRCSLAYALPGWCPRIASGKTKLDFPADHRFCLRLFMPHPLSRKLPSHEFSIT